MGNQSSLVPQTPGKKEDHDGHRCRNNRSPDCEPRRRVRRRRRLILPSRRQSRLLRLLRPVPHGHVRKPAAVPIPLKGDECASSRSDFVAARTDLASPGAWTPVRNAGPDRPLSKRASEQPPPTRPTFGSLALTRVHPHHPKRRPQAHASNSSAPCRSEYEHVHFPLLPFIPPPPLVPESCNL